ncbi:endonuclease III domain-containing protein [Chloroflexota bacterium]
MMKQKLEEIYSLLLNEFGNRRWWPGKTRDEVIIGAILTQNVAWRNTEQAIRNLRGNNLLALRAIHEANDSNIASLIRPTRFYNQKARKLKNFTQFLYNGYQGSLDQMFSEEMQELREKMLGIKGLGRETVDSILLYAGNMPIFVIDAYTVRVFSRLGLTKGNWPYRQYQQFFMDYMDHSVDIFNDFHAQIVHLGFLYCGKNNPQCVKCPLNNICQSCIHII